MCLKGGQSLRVHAEYDGVDEKAPDDSREQAFVEAGQAFALVDGLDQLERVHIFSVRLQAALDHVQRHDLEPGERPFKTKTR